MGRRSFNSVVNGNVLSFLNDYVEKYKYISFMLQVYALLIFINFQYLSVIDNYQLLR